MNNAIELSPELSLIKHTPANNAWFLEHVKVTEIYDEWEKQWVTVEWIQEHYPYFVNQVLGNMSKHPHIDAFRKRVIEGRISAIELKYVENNLLLKLAQRKY